MFGSSYDYTQLFIIALFLNCINELLQLVKLKTIEISFNINSVIRGVILQSTTLPGLNAVEF